MRDPGLGDAALNGIGQQFFVTVTTGPSLIGHRDQLAVFIVGIGIDAGKRADPSGGGPRPRAFSVGYSNALAALYKGGDLLAGNDNRFQGFQCRSPRRIYRPNNIILSDSKTASPLTRIGEETRPFFI